METPDPPINYAGKIKEQKELYNELPELYDTKKYGKLFKQIKRRFSTYKKLSKPAEPVIFLLRNWGDIETYPGARGNTFIIPPNDAEKKLVGKEEMHKVQAERVVHFSNKDIWNLRFGNDTLKVLLFNEDDAMPVNSNPRVWSERLQFTIDAILINYEKYKAQLAAAKNRWITDLVKYIVIGVVLFFIGRWLLGGGETIVIERVIDSATNLGNGSSVPYLP